MYKNSFTKKYSRNNNESFIQRQNSFLMKKEKNYEKNQKLIDEKYSKICKFAPAINSYYSQTTKGISPFIRLYEDSKSRSNRKKQREIDYNNYINEMANTSTKRGHFIDYEKINELYLNPKKNEIIKKTKKKVEEEEGSTFRPYIFYNECTKYIKQNFIELSIKQQNKIFNKRKISSEEKKEIVKNILLKLANDNIK